MTDSVGGPDVQKAPTGELRFKVQLNGVGIGNFAECTGLSAEYEVMEYLPGGAESPVKLRGAIKYPNVVLKRGVTSEDALIKWFHGAKTPSQRHSLTISLIGPDSKPIQTWVFHGAFPLKWQGPTLNAHSTNVATESLEISHAGLDFTQSGAASG
jgi:phage tail-like protein